MSTDTTHPPIATTVEGLPEASTSRTRRRLLSKRAMRLGTALAAIWMILLVAAAIGFPMLPLPDPARSDYSAIAVGPGSPGHILGTDKIGRDILSRLVVGAQVSLAVGLGGIALAVFVGSVLGLVAGFYGGLLSRSIVALMDVLLAFPNLVALIALSVFLGSGLKTIIIGVGLVAAPSVARVTRAATLSFSQREFVIAARGMGAGNLRILVREIVPNVVGPVIAYATVMVAVAIVAEGSLSFLGLGVPPPTSSWGTMMAAGRFDFADNPHVALLPAGAMFITLLSLYFLAEALDRKFDFKEAAL